MQITQLLTECAFGFLSIATYVYYGRAESETVFVKDMAYYLVNRLDTPAYIPDNYTHAFLLRDPHKSVYSLYKMSLNKDLTGNRAA